jgi:hypothetical protein
MSQATRLRGDRRRAACALTLAAIAVVAPAVGRAQLAPASYHATVGEGTGLGGQVSPTGGFSAEVPLDLPAARGGVPIPLRVVYTGQARAGAAGVGWDVPMSYVAWQTDAHTKPAARGVEDERPRRLILALDGAAERMLATDASETRFVPYISDQHRELVRSGDGWLLRALDNLEYRFARVLWLRI